MLQQCLKGIKLPDHTFSSYWKNLRAKTLIQAFSLGGGPLLERCLLLNLMAVFHFLVIVSLPYDTTIFMKIREESHVCGGVKANNIKE